MSTKKCPKKHFFWSSWAHSTSLRVNSVKGSIPQKLKKFWPPILCLGQWSVFRDFSGVPNQAFHFWRRLTTAMRITSNKTIAKTMKIPCKALLLLHIYIMNDNNGYTDCIKGETHTSFIEWFWQTCGYFNIISNKSQQKKTGKKALFLVTACPCNS